MKLFQIALLSAVAIAQRKKKPKQNNNYVNQKPLNPPTKKPYRKTTQKTTTTTPPPATTNPYGAGGNGAGFGDPHFMVSSIGQDPICFDYNPPAGSEMTLVMDPVTGLHVAARVDARRQGKTRFMTRININSPLGAMMTINENGVKLEGLSSWVSSDEDIQNRKNGTMEYGDFIYSEEWSADGSRDKITVDILDGPSFLIKEKVLRETISFGITSTQGLSEKSRGVIGQFVKTNAYKIEKLTDNLATIKLDNGYEVEGVWDTFHRNTKCWTIEEEDLVPLFAN